MNKMIKVRHGNPSDIDELYDMIIGIAEYHDQVAYVKTTREGLLQAGFGPDPKFGVLIAEVNDEVAGFFSYTWNYSIWENFEYMVLDDLFVREEFRGQQVGEHLMNKARDICGEKGVHLMRWEVDRDNERAIKFYKKLGANLSEKGICRWEF